MSCTAKKTITLGHYALEVKCELDRPRHRESHRGVTQGAILIWELTEEEKSNADKYRVGGIDK